MDKYFRMIEGTVAGIARKAMVADILAVHQKHATHKKALSALLAELSSSSLSSHVL